MKSLRLPGIHPSLSLWSQIDRKSEAIGTGMRFQELRSTFLFLFLGQEGWTDMSSPLDANRLSILLCSIFLLAVGKDEEKVAQEGFNLKTERDG